MNATSIAAAVREKALYIENLLSSCSSLVNSAKEEKAIHEQIEEYEMMVAQGSHEMTSYDVQQALAKQRKFRDMLQAAGKSAATTTKFRFVKQQKDNWKDTTTTTTTEPMCMHTSSLSTLENKKDRDDLTHHMACDVQSLMVNNLVNCAVTLTGYRGQQIRIHTTRDTLFRIHYDDSGAIMTTTDQIIIIEDCTNLRFQFVGGPLVEIQDFGWLKQGTPSPNVSIMHHPHSS